MAGLRGSSSGILASTLPTKSAPISAAFVNIPPPILMNNAIRLAPIPTPAIVIGFGYIMYNIAVATNAIAGTARPTVAPPLKAIANVLPNPELVALAALTAAFTVTFREINPATADNVAPTANAIPFDSPIKNPITTANPIATGTIIFISRLRNAAAP